MNTKLINHIKRNKKSYFNLYKSYVKLFYPEYYKYIKPSRLFIRTKSTAKKLALKRSLIADVDLDTKVINIYDIKNKIDFSKTILHEFAHIIAYNLFKITGHGPKWKKILNELRNPMQKITKGKLNIYF